MYEGAIAGMYLFGIYGGLLLFSYLVGWTDSSCSERVFVGIVILFMGLLFLLCWNSKNEVLKRQPVISSCVSVGNKFEMVDSTLRCKSGEDPRYTVMKEERKMVPNEPTPCENCGKTMIHHCDVSCVKTDKQLKSEALIDWMNAPI